MGGQLFFFFFFFFAATAETTKIHGLKLGMQRLIGLPKICTRYPSLLLLCSGAELCL